MLQNPLVLRWLGGIEPAWTLLDQVSFFALRAAPAPAGPIRLATDLSSDELHESAVARNALILLQEASIGPGLKLTATGNLTRKVVAEMVERFDWPDFDKAEAFRFNKVINEPDFMPLLMLRLLIEAGRLVRPRKGYLNTTASGRRFLGRANQPALQALLFHLEFWAFDFGFLGRGQTNQWPLDDFGIALWSLSVAASEWQTRERLTRMCTIPINGVLESSWDNGTFVVDGAILRPLFWFGLLEHRTEPISGQRFLKQHFYRKSPLFDRFLSFDVKLEAAAGMRH